MAEAHRTSSDTVGASDAWCASREKDKRARRHSGWAASHRKTVLLRTEKPFIDSFADPIAVDELLFARSLITFTTKTTRASPQKSLQLHGPQTPTFVPPLPESQTFPTPISLHWGPPHWGRHTSTGKFDPPSIDQPQRTPLTSTHCSLNAPCNNISLAQRRLPSASKLDPAEYRRKSVDAS